MNWNSKELFEIRCAFSSLVSSLYFDFIFDVLAEDQAKARIEARQILNQSKLATNDSHVSIYAIVQKS